MQSNAPESAVERGIPSLSAFQSGGITSVLPSRHAFASATLGLSLGYMGKSPLEAVLELIDEDCVENQQPC
jgi:hypothetical protein